MTQAILVTSLRIEAVSGPTCYPGENGFSSVSARAGTDDSGVAAALDTKARAGELVSVRCGLLEVSGKLDKELSSSSLNQFTIQIQSVSYGQPPQVRVGA